MTPPVLRPRWIEWRTPTSVRVIFPQGTESNANLFQKHLPDTPRSHVLHHIRTYIPPARGPQPRGSSPWPIRNWATRQEVSGRQASKASFASPHRSHYRLNRPSPAPPTRRGKTVFREIGPWYQNGWGPLHRAIWAALSPVKLTHKTSHQGGHLWHLFFPTSPSLRAPWGRSCVSLLSVYRTKSSWTKELMNMGVREDVPRWLNASRIPRRRVWSRFAFPWWLAMLSIFSCAHSPFVYLSWNNIYSNPLPTFLKLIFFLIYYLAALGLLCCAQAFSSWGERRLLFVEVRGLLIAVASLVAEHGL